MQISSTFTSWGPRLLIAVLIALTMLPFLAIEIPPMTDLVQHLLVAHILNEYPSTELGYGKDLVVDLSFKTTLLPELLLALLQKVAGPFLGARIYLSIFVLAVWASMVFFLKSLRREHAEWIALGSLPLCLSGFVYMGFLPFITTFPLFLLLLGVWQRFPSSPTRSLLAGLLLLVIYSCHLVGAVISAFAIAFLALMDVLEKKQRARMLLVDAAALLPFLLAGLAYFGGKDHPSSLKMDFPGPLGSIRAFIGFNASSISSHALFVNCAGLLLLAATIGVLIGYSKFARRWLLLVIALLVIGLVSPITVGSLWPGGPRLFPFMFLTSFALLELRGVPLRAFVAITTIFIIVIVGLTMESSVRINEHYRQFLSGVDKVAPGSRILPVVNTHYDQVGAIRPFWSIASAYTVLRGGSNPYIFAAPYVKTGGAILTYRDYGRFSHAYLYSEDESERIYEGVGKNYDYLLVWDEEKESRRFPADLEPIHEAGPLRLYRRK